jgi:hypothetical protein
MEREYQKCRGRSNIKDLILEGSGLSVTLGPPELCSTIGKLGKDAIKFRFIHVFPQSNGDIANRSLRREVVIGA